MQPEMSSYSIKLLEDGISNIGFSDRTVNLGAAVFLGGSTILSRYGDLAFAGVELKSDGSSVGLLEKAAGQKIADYLNSSPAVSSCKFRTEEGMMFRRPKSYDYAGIIDELDGSNNVRIGGTNLFYIGAGGVIHARLDDEQVAAATMLPFRDKNTLFIAEKGKGTHAVRLTSARVYADKVRLESTQAPIFNSTIESGWMSPSTTNAEERLRKAGFYDSLGISPRDRVTGGIFQTVSGLIDNRQVVLNIAPSHQADCCYLLLVEAGGDVIGQNGRPMYGKSYAMLYTARNFLGERQKLKDQFVQALEDYRGWNPGKVSIPELFE